MYKTSASLSNSGNILIVPEQHFCFIFIKTNHSSLDEAIRLIGKKELTIEFDGSVVLECVCGKDVTSHRPGNKELGVKLQTETDFKGKQNLSVKLPVSRAWEPDDLAEDNRSRTRDRRRPYTEGHDRPTPGCWRSQEETHLLTVSMLVTHTRPLRKHDV